MADAILAFVDDPIARDAAVAHTAQIVQAGSWEHEANGYLALVELLIGS
jgi:hypothetical protein